MSRGDCAGWWRGRDRRARGTARRSARGCGARLCALFALCGGAALAFDDGAVVAAANVENASYGLSLCAEAVALAKAMNEGRRGGSGGRGTGLALGDGPVMPCGRCRQMLSELALLGGTDPMVWSGSGASTVEVRLSALLPWPSDLTACAEAGVRQWYSIIRSTPVLDGEVLQGLACGGARLLLGWTANWRPRGRSAHPRPHLFFRRDHGLDPASVLPLTATGWTRCAFEATCLYRIIGRTDRVQPGRLQHHDRSDGSPP